MLRIDLSHLPSARGKAGPLRSTSVKPQTLPPPRAVALSIMEVAAETLAPPPPKPLPAMVPAVVPKLEAPDLTVLQLEASGTKPRRGRGKGLLVLAALGGLGAGAWLAREEPVVAAAWAVAEGAVARVAPVLTQTWESIAGSGASLPAAPTVAPRAEASTSVFETAKASSAVETAPAKSAPASAEALPVLSLEQLPALGTANETRHASTPARADGAPSKAQSSALEPAAKERESVAAGARPDRAALVAALNQVASAAAGCGERPGPVRVQVTFGTSGVARSVSVSGEGLTPQLRSCISAAASRARVGAFSGEPITVAKSL